MTRRSKRFREAVGQLDLTRTYSPEEALDLLKKFPHAKFDETLELCLKMGVDPKKADQQVRSTVGLPHGTGKVAKVLVFAKGDKAKAAIDAGADYVGDEELADKILEGWIDFTVVVATPDMMRIVGKLGKVLGPRGLMPSPKAGTVTQDVAKAVAEIKAGKIEFKVDKGGNIHTLFGKMSFSKQNLLENFNALLDAIMKSKPNSVKGAYIRGMTISSTMGPGLKIEYHAAV